MHSASNMGLLPCKDVAQPFFDNLSTCMKKTFIQQYGIDLFYIQFPSGNMNLINITDQGKLYISNTIFRLFQEEIDTGKHSKSWLCIVIEQQDLSFDLRTSQEMMEPVNTISHNKVHDEIRLICETFNPNMVIPVMLVMNLPACTRTDVIGAFPLPW